MLILASASSARARLLRDAGIEAAIRPAPVDEDAIKASLRAEGAKPRDVAVLLAETKAERVSAREPDALVIGADQMLSCGDVWFDKPPDLEHARAQLAALRGRTHQLHTAVVLARRGATIWRHAEQADLTMRDFSDSFLDGYLRAESEAVLHSVGAYRLEGPGVQLFSGIDGDHFTIQGLPMIPLLNQLRTLGELPR